MYEESDIELSKENEKAALELAIRLRIRTTKECRCPYGTLRELLDLADEARARACADSTQEEKTNLRSLDDYLNWEASVLSEAEGWLYNLRVRGVLHVDFDRAVDVQVLVACAGALPESCCFAAKATDPDSGRRFWLLADEIGKALKTRELDDKTRSLIERMEKGEENRDSVGEHFAILAFLEAFLESKDEDNDFDTASEVLWSAFEKICLRQDFVNRMFFLAHPSWLHETPCCDMP